MTLAVTAPHGLAAWIGWVFAIVAPLASLVVSVVALYIAGGDKRREQREREAGELRTARMVTASVQIDTGVVVGFDVDVSGIVRNDSDEAIQDVVLCVWNEDSPVSTPHRVLTSHFVGRRSEVDTDGEVEIPPDVLGLDPNAPGGYAVQVEAIRWSITWTDLSGQQWHRTTTADPVRVSPPV